MAKITKQQEKAKKETPSEEREDTFAEKLSLLFETKLSPDLDPYTLVEVADGTGGSISPTYLMNLRDGKFSNPSMSKIKSLSKFFSVPITYFYDEDGARKLRESLKKEFGETIEALSSGELRKDLAEKTKPRAQAILINIVKKKGRTG